MAFSDSMKNKLKSPSEYAKSPGRCPVCNSTQIEGHSVEIDSNMATQSVTCLECGAAWDDQYKLMGYANLEDGNGKEIRPNRSQKEIVALFDQINKADIISIDDGPVLTSWNASPVSKKFDAENEILHFTWDDEGLVFSIILCEDGLREAVVDGNEIRVWEKDSGEDCTIRLLRTAPFDIEA